MDILGMIAGKLEGSDALERLGSSVGASPDQVRALAGEGLPALMQALGRNAGTADGAASLAGALDQHQDDGVDDMAGFLQGVDAEDGAKILGHLFPEGDADVRNGLARSTGLDAGQVAGLLQRLAPLVLGVLGRQKKDLGLDASGISGLLGGFAGGGGNPLGAAAGLLDADKDGSVLDDVGDLLGGLLGKKP